MMDRVEREGKTLKIMISMYCIRHHGSKNNLCDSCSEVHNYALKRTAHCRFGDHKPVCSACPIHCYKKDMRQKIRVIMRFSGPRIILSHPFLAFRHLIDKKRNEFFNEKFNKLLIK